MSHHILNGSIAKESVAHNADPLVLSSGRQPVKLLTGTVLHQDQYDALAESYGCSIAQAPPQAALLDPEASGLARCSSRARSESGVAALGGEATPCCAGLGGVPAAPCPPTARPAVAAGARVGAGVALCTSARDDAVGGVGFAGGVTGKLIPIIWAIICSRPTFCCSVNREAGEGLAVGGVAAGASAIGDGVIASAVVGGVAAGTADADADD